MMGVEITSVQVQWVAARPEEPRSARFAIILLGFETGAIGTLEWSGDSGYGYEVEVEIVGETGTARTVSNTSPILRQSGSAAQAITPNWPERFADSLCRRNGSLDRLGFVGNADGTIGMGWLYVACRGRRLYSFN